MTTLYQQPHLPQKFAENLLDCEIQLELNDKITPHMIMKLLELYRVGLEYYQSIRSYKYLYFQRKMNNIVKSEKIVNNLNEKKQEKQIVIESLSDFKKEQIAINYGNKINSEGNKDGFIVNNKQLLTDPSSLNSNIKLTKKSTPFKRHLQQKIQQHHSSNEQKKLYELQQRQKREQQLKKLQQLQQKQKQILMNTQITQKTQLLSSNQQIKKIINQYDEKFNEFDQKISKNIQEQEEEFNKKLKERRQRVKSNTDKRRLTKSFSDMGYFIQENQQNGTGQQGTNNIQEGELNAFIEVKNPRRRIPSTKMFSSFVQQKTKPIQEQDQFSNFVFQQIGQIQINPKLSINTNVKEIQVKNHNQDLI